MSTFERQLFEQKTPHWLAAELVKAQAALYSYACVMLGGSPDAWDLLQNANKVILEKAADLKAPEDFMPWAYTILRFQALALRKKAVRDEHIFSVEVLEKISQHMNVQSHDFPERMAALAECVNKLPARQREHLEMRYNDGLRPCEVAQRLGRAENSVVAMLYRARVSLAKCISSKLAESCAP